MTRLYHSIALSTLLILLLCDPMQARIRGEREEHRQLHESPIDFVTGAFGAAAAKQPIVVTDCIKSIKGGSRKLKSTKGSKSGTPLCESRTASRGGSIGGGNVDGSDIEGDIDADEESNIEGGDNNIDGGNDGDSGNINGDGGNDVDAGGEPVADTNAPSPSPGGDISGVPDEPTACQQVADQTLVTSAAYTTFDLKMGLAVSSTASVEQILDELRSELQTTVAPSLTNCSANEMVGRRLRANLGRVLQSGTIVNVGVGDIEVDQFNDCSEFSAASDGQTICITTLSQVSAYYVDSTDGFSADLETAIMSTDFGIDGLVVASSLATQSPDGTPSVPEGEGNPPDQDDIGVDNDDGVSGIEEPSNVQPGSTGITAGAAVGVAFAVLVVALALIFVRQRSYRNSEEDSLLKAVHTDDEDDDMMFGVSYSHKPRLTHVVGEDDSIVTSGYSNDGIEVQPMYADSRLDSSSLLDTTYDDGYLNDYSMEVDSQDNIHAAHHWCSSPHCQSCELKRQKGVQFIPTSEPMTGMIPRNARRDYHLNDTVQL